MILAQVTASPALLKEVKLLARLSDAELLELIALGETKVYEPHTNVIIEGEMTWGLFIILDGMVGIFKHNKISGDTYDVGQIRQGSFFGEMSLVDDNPRSASVRSLTPCHLLYISKTSFNDWLNKSPERRLRFYEDCVKDLVNRLRTLDENFVVSQYQLWQSVLRNSLARKVYA